MKQIINQSDKIVTLAGVPIYAIIGILRIEDNTKAWLQPLVYRPTTQSENEQYKAFCVDGGVHHGNGYETFNSLAQALNPFVNRPNSFRVYLFDSEKELFKWLSE